MELRINRVRINRSRPVPLLHLPCTSDNNTDFVSCVVLHLLNDFIRGKKTLQMIAFIIMIPLQTEIEGVKMFTLVRALARHRVIDISMHNYHSAVVVEPGHVYTFGRNTEGQLGTGNTRPQNAIIEVKIFEEKTAFVSFIRIELIIETWRHRPILPFVEWS